MKPHAKMHRLIASAGIVALIAVVMSLVVSLAACNGTADTIETASDVEVLLADIGRTVEFVDFAPGVSREDAVNIATGILRDTHSKQVDANTEIRASVALYSGSHLNMGQMIKLSGARFG